MCILCVVLLTELQSEESTYDCYYLDILCTTCFPLFSSRSLPPLTLAPCLIPLPLPPSLYLSHSLLSLGLRPSNRSSGWEHHRYAGLGEKYRGQRVCHNYIRHCPAPRVSLQLLYCDWRIWKRKLLSSGKLHVRLILVSC